MNIFGSLLFAIGMGISSLLLAIGLVVTILKLAGWLVLGLGGRRGQP